MSAITDGAVRQILDGDNSDKSFCPILQVLQVKPVEKAGGGGGGTPRYRVVLSDGQIFVQGMLATQLVESLINGPNGITENSLIRVTDYMRNDVQGKVVVILLKAEAVPGGPMTRIGSPVEHTQAPAARGPPPAQQQQQPLYNSTNGVGVNNNNNNNNQSAKPSGYGGGSNPYGGGGGSQQQRSTSSAPIGRSQYSTGGETSSSGQPITRISNLNMYNNRWTIKARVTTKSDIRTWNNAKGEGRLFSIELLDESGQDIRGTFFKEAVDQFYNQLQVGNVYRFSGGRLKVANLQWNTCKSQFEITFDQNSEIHLDNDDSQIARQNYEFCKIDAIEGKQEQTLVDLLAVVKNVGDPTNLISKKSGKELTKCDVTLIDDSNTEINMTLWGEKATTAPSDLGGNPVVAVRRARISDYGGKSLNGGDGIEVNPQDLPEVQPLKQWWDTTGSQGGGASRTLSSRNGGGFGKQDPFPDRKMISSIKEENMGHNTDGKADWLSFKCVVSFIKKDREGGAWYTACPNSGEPCKNRYKVNQTTDQQYYCEKCQQTYPNCVRKWIFSGVVLDESSSTWVSFFNEQAESLLEGRTADEVYAHAYGENFDQDIYESVFAKSTWSEWIMKCKVKSEIVNDESRVKTSVYSMTPVNYLQEANDILTELAKF